MGRLFVLLFVPAVLFFAGCHREESPPASKDGATESREDLEAKRLQMEREKNEMYRQMKEQLDRTERQIEELKAEAKRTGKYDEPKFRDRVDRLEQKEFNLRGNLEQIKNASLAAWEDLKPRIRAALDDLVGGLENAISEFRFSRPSPSEPRHE